MTDLQQLYKKRVFGFGNTAEGRRIRAKEQQQSRKDHRDQIFAKNRNVADPDIENPLNKGDRLQQLLKWKAERQRLKKLESRKKKPAFKVGVVHHKFYSPIIKNTNPVPTVSKEPSPVKRVTRATEKRLLAKAKGETLQKDVNKIPTLQSHTGKDKKQKNFKKTKEESFAPPNHKFKAPSCLPTMPPFGRIPLQYTPVLEKKKSLFMSPLVFEEKQDHTVKSKEMPCASVDSSIEAINLRLSSDDGETSSSNHKDESKFQDSKLLNKSGSKASTPKNSAVLDDSGIRESSVKNASFTSVQTSSPKEPVFFSPYVVLSRGKTNARKEQQIRRGLGCSPSDVPTKDTVMKNLNISVEEEERTAQYFKFILSREVDRLTDLCNRWAQIKSEADVTEDAQYLINQAVGQTGLLMNKKFERFRKLVSDCETGKGEMLVTCRDLQGFWDMMYMEIQDCDSRFDKLEKLRARAWVEEQPDNVKPIVRKKVAVKKKAVAAKQSSVRSLILAARKKKAVQNVENRENADEIVFGNISGNKTSTSNEKSNTEESMSNKKYSMRKSLTSSAQRDRRSKSFGRSQQVFTPTKQGNARLSLLHKAQLSEASKNLKSPLCMMKISKMCKTPEIQSDDTISYVNSDQTPGKSILKHSQHVVEAESRTRSMHKVNFDDNIVLNEVPVDEEVKTKLNLAAALARIDSYDIDGPDLDMFIHTERKLNFDSDSSDEAEDVFQTIDKKNYNVFEDYSTLPTIKILAENSPVNKENLLPKKKIPKDVLNSPLHKNDLKKEDVQVNTEDNVNHPVSNIPTISCHENEMKQSDVPIRTLRSRTVTTVDMLKTRRNSMRDTRNENESELKENKTPKTRRSSLKTPNKNQQKVHTTNDIDNALGKISLNEDLDKRRRSSRKSVRFTAEDCTACVQSKPTLPMTPHLKRSKTRYSEDQSNVCDRDLISWNTPERPPARIRRSSQSRKV